MPYATEGTHQERGSGELTSLCRIMASPVAAGAAISRFWEETCVRRNAVDLLQGTGLDQMGKELKFWCYRLDDVSPASTHALLVRQMNIIFDPVGVEESGQWSMSSMPRNSQVVNACKHPCVCDPYGGVMSPTVFQWRSAPRTSGRTLRALGCPQRPTSCWWELRPGTWCRWWRGCRGR